MYQLAVLGLWLLLISIFVPLWPFELIVSFLMYIIGIAAVIIAFEVWRKQHLKPGLAFAIFPLAVALILPLDVLVSTTNKADDPNAITLFTQNVLYKTQNAKEVATQAKASGADIVALQEVLDHQVETISKILGFEEIYVSDCDCSVNKDKLALISRYPIIEAESVDVDVRGGLMIDVTLNVQDEPMRVLVVHLPAPILPSTYTTRERGFEALNDQINSGSLKSSVIMGDFNTTPWSSSLRNFSAQNPQLKNVISEGSARPTWCDDYLGLFCLRIDHTFIDRDYSLLSSSVGQQVGSDHRPIITRILR